MAETTKVDEILARHRTGEGSQEFTRKPITEAGEIFGNLDSPRHINVNTIIDKEERRCLLIIDELNSFGLGFEESNISQTFKELSVSVSGTGREQKKDIAQGMMKSRSGGGGLAALFQRQPAEGNTGGNQNG